MDINMRLPDFIGIGSPRCGTTYLLHLLNQHPDIYFAPYFKEIHFFDNNYQRGLKWYSSFYNNIPEQILCGDFTPSYMQSEQVIRMIKQFNPQIKLIVCIRNPVERAYSHYMQRNRFQNWNCDFDETVRKNDQGILDYGLYGFQLERVLHNFPRDQVNIIIFEDLIENPQKILSGLFSFLKVNNFIIVENYAPTNYMKKFHFKTVKQMVRGIRSLSRKYVYFRKLFYNVFPGRSFIRFIRKVNMKEGTGIKRGMSGETKKYLAEYYAEDKILFERIIGKTISNWETNKYG